MIRHLFLDIDDTLLDFGAQETAALQAAFQELGLEVDDAGIARYRQINMEQWRQHDLGFLNREQVLYGRFARLFAELGIDASPKQMEDSYRRRLGQAAVPVTGSLEALDYLAGKYHLYIATNGLIETQYARLELAGMTRYFRKIFISDELGAPKPEREFFLRAFAQLPDLIPTETMIIGDNLRSDILGGLQAGIHTCWFNYHHLPPEPEIIPEYTITNWHEIAQLL